MSSMRDVRRRTWLPPLHVPTVDRLAAPCMCIVTPPLLHTLGAPQTEIKQGEAYVRALDVYAQHDQVTDLLLLHTSKYPASSPLKKYSCGY